MSNDVTRVAVTAQSVTLADVCEKSQYGFTTSAAKEGTLKFLRTTDITKGAIDWATVPFCDERPADPTKYLLKDGDIVISRAGSVGFSCRVISPEPAVFASYLIRFRPKSIIDGRFLAYFLQSPSYWSQVRAEASGIALQNLNATKLERFLLPLPPRSVQEAVVLELDMQLSRLEAGVSALKRAQANLKRYRASVLKAACEGRLVPTEASLARQIDPVFEPAEHLLQKIRNIRDHHRKKPATPFDDSIRIVVPQGWALASLDQLSVHLTSGSRDWSQYYGVGTGRFILAQNVRPMKLDLTESQPVSPPMEDAETVRTLVNKDDLLITIVGAKTGDVCRVPSQLREHYVCQSVALLRPGVSHLAKYLEIWLASPENGQAIWKQYTYGQGRPHLSFEQLRMTPVAVPPFAEQERIVAEVERRLSVVDELEATITANLRRTTRLRQAILQKAFGCSQ